MGKVNGCFKDIGLRNFFRNFLWKKKMATEFFFLYIFSMKVVLKLSKLKGTN